MARYKKTKIGRHKSKQNSTFESNVLSYRTTYYDKIPIRDDDVHVITQDGDRLDNMSMQFYNTPSLRWYIARANGLNAINVPAGTNLRIPSSIEYANGK